MVYFDYTAAYPADSILLKKAVDECAGYYANPSSLHAPGRQAREKLEETRKRVAGLLGIRPGGLYFCSGGTEANNIVYQSLLQKPSRGDVVISSCEHPSSYEPAAVLEKFGYNIIRIPHKRTGILDVGKLRDLVGKKTKLVSVIAVSNETGAIQPLSEIRQLLAEHENEYGNRIHFHSDFVQVPGKIEGKKIYSIPDSFSVSGHKFGSARGIGLLYSKKEMQTLAVGGGQENNMRPGTENLLGAAGLAMALQQRLETNKEAVPFLKRRLLENISDIPGLLVLFAEGTYLNEEYTPFIASFGFRGLNGEIMVRALSEKGFYCSAGSACSSRHRKISPCFEALGIPASEADCFIRISLHESHTRENIDDLSEAIASTVSEYSV